MDTLLTRRGNDQFLPPRLPHPRRVDALRFLGASRNVSKRLIISYLFPDCAFSTGAVQVGLFVQDPGGKHEDEWR
jgi:hypothetical protein